MGIVSKDEYVLISGRGVGNSLIEALDSAGERVWIVSPGLDSKYAGKLREKSENGADVRLLTDPRLIEPEVFRELFSREEIDRRGFLYDYRFLFLFLTVFSLVGVGLGINFRSPFTAIPVALSVVSAGLTLMAYISGGEDVKYTVPLDLRLLESGELTNSRIYILDDKAFVGSADLTGDGLWKNIEVLFELRSREMKKNIETAFENLCSELEEFDEGEVQELVEES